MMFLRSYDVRVWLRPGDTRLGDIAPQFPLSREAVSVRLESRMEALKVSQLAQIQTSPGATNVTRPTLTIAIVAPDDSHAASLVRSRCPFCIDAASRTIRPGGRPLARCDDKNLTKLAFADGVGARGASKELKVYDEKTQPRQLKA